jgi:hypothetical protein
MAQKPHMLERRRKAQLAAAKAPGKSYAYETPRNPAMASAAPKDPWVTFIPGRSVSAVDRKLRIISVTDRHRSANDELLKTFKDYIHLPINPTMGDVFYNGSVTIDLFQELHAWIQKDLTTPIVVHCGEGIMRSPAIAEFITDYYPYKPYYDYQLCPKHIGNLDTGVYRTLTSLFEELEVTV